MIGTATVFSRTRHRIHLTAVTTLLLLPVFIDYDLEVATLGSRIMTALSIIAYIVALVCGPRPPQPPPTIPEHVPQNDIGHDV